MANATSAQPANDNVKTAGVRLIDFPGLRELNGIPYSRVHLLRLEKAGEFPRRVQLSASRVAWVESEIDGWLAARLAARPLAA
jgi:prophage regulatory protein